MTRNDGVWLPRYSKMLIDPLTIDANGFQVKSYTDRIRFLIRRYKSSGGGSIITTSVMCVTIS